MSASNVRNARACFQARVHAIQRGNPLAYQVCGIARAKEPLGAMEQFMVVLMPPHSFAGAKCLNQSRHRHGGRKRYLESARKERRALLVRQRECLFLAQTVPTRWRIE